MKYYHEIYRDGYEPQSYSGEYMPPINTPIYGFSYDINDDTKNRRLICKPTLGEIVDENNPYNITIKGWALYNFIPYKSNNKSFRKSGIVNMDSRMYADTKEEAIEMYNELVNKRIDKLQEMIEEAKGDLI